nr:hypothetical protein [Tanacetum cinerariifolium]
MKAPVIFISSDVSVESVGSSFPGIRRRRAILIRPEEDIPIGRIYRTYPGGPCKALTASKLVRPLPSHRLALYYTSHHLNHFTSRSSSSHSTLDHSSFRHSILGHSLPPPDTTDADSSTPLRFVHPSHARTPWCSKAYLRWRSPTATVISSIHAMRALVPSLADLLPPHKRFRDSISPEDSVEEDIDTDVLEDIKAHATAFEVAVDRDVKAEIDTGIDMKIDVGVDVEDEVEDEAESSDREISLQRIEDIEKGHRGLEARSMIAGGEKASLLDHVASLERSNARLQGTMMMETARADKIRRRMRFIESELRQIRRFCYYDMMRFRRLETFVARRLEHDYHSFWGVRPVAKECTYQDFMKCQPLIFKGMKGVVSKAYLRWRSAPLSTMYLPTTSESSAGDSSSESLAGPSHKRCRSPAATVISSIHAMRALVPSLADLLPPHKRFRDSISPEDSVEEDIDTDVLEDIKADAITFEVAVDRDVKAEIDTGIDMKIDVGVDVEDEVEDEASPVIEVLWRLEWMWLLGLIPDEISLQRIEDIEKGQRGLEARSMIAGGEKASLLDHVASLERSNARLQGTMMMERARADKIRGVRPVAKECTYQDFMKCQPLIFKGTKGVVRLIRWFEKMETVFHIIKKDTWKKGNSGSYPAAVLNPREHVSRNMIG